MQKSAILGHTNGKIRNCGKDQRKEESKMAKILVIGGGVSGLSAGIYGCLTGNSVTICEKHAIPGGNLTGWQRGDYRIDNCIHWLTGTNPVTKTYKMWRELGALGGVEVIQCDTLYTCEVGGKRLSLYRDLHRLKREMLAISPKDSGETRNFISAVEYMQGLCGIGGEQHDESLSNSEKLAGLPLIAKYYSLSVDELAARFTHPLLRKFIGSFWGNSFGALSLVFVFAHFCGENGGIPRGSSVEMAKRMAERFKTLGGELLCGKEAVRVICRGGKAEQVIFSDGTTLCADFVILTSDPATVFGHLLDTPMPRGLKRFYKDPRFKRFSSLHAAFSVDSSTLPFDGDFVISIPKEYRPLFRASHFVLREYSHEKSFAPDGKNIIQAMVFCDEAYCRDLIRLKERDATAYKKKKQALATAFSELIAKQFPALDGKLGRLDVWTPATYRRFTGAEVGSFMSFTLPSKAFPRRVSCRVPGIDNLFLATQWQQLPGGLPIAAESGRLAVEEVVKALRREGEWNPEQLPRRIAIAKI